MPGYPVLEASVVASVEALVAWEDAAYEAADLEVVSVAVASQDRRVPAVISQTRIFTPIILVLINRLLMVVVG